MNNIIIFDAGDELVQVRLEGETVLLTQARMMALFERDQSVISRHIRNVFKEGELPPESNMQKMHIAGSDKPIALYSLAVIISVGYRVKSQRGVQFRQWATSVLRQHLQRLQEWGIEFEQQLWSMGSKNTRSMMQLDGGWRHVPRSYQGSFAFWPVDQLAAATP